MRTTKDGLSPTELVGKVVILHAGPDNFGNVPVGSALDQYTANAADAVTKTQAPGNAGYRFACGVIALPGCPAVGTCDGDPDGPTRAGPRPARLAAAGG